jgi:hypothetical protein
MSHERDPALIPGLTAGQWETRAQIALAGVVGAIPVALIAVAFGAPATPALAGVTVGVLVAFFVVWIVLTRRSLATIKAERAAGYSTVIDAAGFELRHPVTGALERAAQVPPVIPGRVHRSLVAGMLRVRPDSPLGKRLDN